MKFEDRVTFNIQFSFHIFSDRASKPTAKQFKVVRFYKSFDIWQFSIKILVFTEGDEQKCE